jgi:3-methylcrotonyl-CoA carboxylase alpha subunit
MLPSETGGIEMRRRINLKQHQYDVTVFGRPNDRFLQIGQDTPKPVSLTRNDEGDYIITHGETSAHIQLASKGENVYIHAFGRSFSLYILDPVEQAAQASGKRDNRARAPMPGTVVEIHVAPGDPVEKGQALLTIESMKILTVIPAPRKGEVFQVHFAPGDTFDKNAVLVTLIEEEGS